MSSDITFINKVQEALKAGVIIGDGHTLFAPEFYEPYFTATELAHLIHKHESHGSSAAFGRCQTLPPFGRRRLNNSISQGNRTATNTPTTAQAKATEQPPTKHNQ